MIRRCLKSRSFAVSFLGVVHYFQYSSGKTSKESTVTPQKLSRPSKQASVLLSEIVQSRHISRYNEFAYSTLMRGRRSEISPSEECGRNLE